MSIPRTITSRLLVTGVFGFAVCLLGWASLSSAEKAGPGINPRLPSLASDAMLELPIRVLDTDGDPVVGADVRRWSQWSSAL